MLHRKFRAGPAGLTICLGLTLSLAGASESNAQVVNASGIEGIVTDATGGVLPGVTATLESPQLTVPQVVRVTDGEGGYRFTWASERTRSRSSFPVSRRSFAKGSGSRIASRRG